MCVRVCARGCVCVCVYVRVCVCTTLQQHVDTARCNSWPSTTHDILQLTATHCNILQHMATHCNTPQHSTTHCTALQYTATHSSRQTKGLSRHTATHAATHTTTHTATHSNTLQHTLQHTVTSCNTLQYTATYYIGRVTKGLQKTHCNALQHTATHTRRQTKGLLVLQNGTPTMSEDTMLQHDATLCNTQLYSATYYSTLQHTTT